MTPDRSRTPPPALLLALLADQYLRWQWGERVAVEAYLERWPALWDEPEAVVDLIYHEIVLREECGDPPSLEEYGSRFPEHEARLRDQIRIHRLFQELRSR
jgi:hypothetical protein